MFEKEYSKESEKCVKRAQTIWDKMYNDRTNMLWAKEEYLNSYHTYYMLKEKVEQVQIDQKKVEKQLEQKGMASTVGRSLSIDELDDIQDSEQINMIKKIEAQDQILINLEDASERAKQNSKAAENTYKRALEKMNACIE